MSTRTRTRAKPALEARLGPLSLGHFLLSIRESEGRSQTELADMLGVTRAHVCDLEKGRKGLSVKRAAEFADVLGYPQVQFVKLALQHQLVQAGLPLKVDVRTA